MGDTVYLGDSITDLPALMAADYGIVIRQSKKLRDILQAAGIAIAPLGGAPMRSRGPASVTGVLYTAEWCALGTEASSCGLGGFIWKGGMDQARNSEESDRFLLRRSAPNTRSQHTWMDLNVIEVGLMKLTVRAGELVVTCVAGATCTRSCSDQRLETRCRPVR